jgi:CHAD domain-containing protein
MARKGGAKPKWGPKNEDAAANASRELPILVSRFFADTRQVLAKPLTADMLHKLRIAGKKLRYTLELFRPVYAAGLEERLDELKKLQDWLGDAHDVAAAREIIGKRALQNQPGIAEFLNKREAAQVAGFTRYWKKTFDAKGQEAWWTDFLSQEARPPRAAL